MNEIEKAIESISYERNLPNWYRHLDYDIIDIALAALREKAEREAGCEYCTTVDSATAYRRFYKSLFEGSDLVCIAQSIKHPDKFYLHVEMDNGGDGDCEISSCPHCGRKLVP